MRFMNAPAVLVTGVAEGPMTAATISLQWDLPRAVVLQHRIDVSARRVHRVVSDVTGVLDQAAIDLEHACVSCAVREDVVPMLRRLAGDGRWDAVLVHLPVGAEASQVCRVLAHDRGATAVPVAGVLAALDAERVVDDLLGDDLLVERGLHSGVDDQRGVGETLASIVEYADHLVLHGAADRRVRGLVRSLARPGAQVVGDSSDLEGTALLQARRRHEEAEAWAAEVRRGPLNPSTLDDVWTLDLRSSLPFHPQRLHESIEAVGGGPRRSRGCFWLPTRPAHVCGWEGAGGQLSIGPVGTWAGDPPLTRIVVTGLDDGPEEIRAAFQHALLTQAEAASRGTIWEVLTDGFEPWLGPLHHAA